MRKTGPAAIAPASRKAGGLMRAVVLERYGGPDGLKLREVKKPAPKDDEVLARAHAASINDWDWGLLKGDFVNRMMNGLFRPKPRILGCDVAGRVEAVGAKVRAFKPGDEVFGDLCASGFGAFADYVCAPQASLAPMPAGMSFVEAAAIPQAGMLAVQGLIDVGRIGSGQHVLLNGAGGGVGTFALQLARLHDAEVTAVDSAGKLEMLSALGADHVIDYRQEDFTKSGRRYDLILDTKSNRSPWAYARALERDGAYLTVGGEISRGLEALLLSPLISRAARKHIRIVVLKPNKNLGYLSELFEAGKLRPVIDGPYKLADIAEAFRLFGAAGHPGKIIVTMGWRSNRRRTSVPGEKGEARRGNTPVSGAYARVIPESPVLRDAALRRLLRMRGFIRDLSLLRIRSKARSRLSASSPRGGGEPG